MKRSPKSTNKYLKYTPNIVNKLLFSFFFFLENMTDEARVTRWNSDERYKSDFRLLIGHRADSDPVWFGQKKLNALRKSFFSLGSEHTAQRHFIMKKM